MNKALQKFDVEKLSVEQRGIVECIGISAYYQLALKYGGSMLYIAKPDLINKEQRNQQIIKDFDEGATYKQLAAKYGLSTVRIKNIINERG